MVPEGYISSAEYESAIHQGFKIPHHMRAILSNNGEYIEFFIKMDTKEIFNRDSNIYEHANFWITNYY